MSESGNVVQAHNAVFKPPRSRDWTPEHIERLETADVQQLRENAEKLGATTVVALCDTALAARPNTVSRSAGAPGVPKQYGHLISRQAAFQARGVFSADVHSGWSGVRKADGMVVMTLWAAAVKVNAGRCSQLLWTPNVDGSRPWSDTPAGRERLRHCILALERGGAEGMLVHGEHFDGEAAEHNARTIYGVESERVVRFKVEQKGAEYWAMWGAKRAARAL
jgi:hypothetical protein